MHLWNSPLTLKVLASIHLDVATTRPGIERVEVSEIDCASRITMAILVPTR